MENEKSAIWHVMSRGVRQSPIFLSDDDRLTFYRFLDWGMEKTKTKLIQHCLMDNHYHLLTQGDKSSLSRAMQIINSHYAKEFNHRVGSGGHLFQGRYKAYQAKSDVWVAQRSVYIHLNPVAAGITKNPLEYRWSSLRATLGESSELESITLDPLLRLFGTEKKNQEEAYHRYLLQEQSSYFDLADETDRIIGKYGEKATSSKEEIRLQVHETKRLRQIVDVTLRDRGHHKRATMKLRNWIVCQLSNRWKIGSRPVVAEALTISVKTVEHYRRMSIEKWGQTQEIRRMIEQICHHFTNSITFKSPEAA